MSNFRTKIVRKVKNGLQSVDSLGYPITLTYKKSQTYQSVIGGIFTLIGKILIIIYFGFQIQNVVNRSQTTISYYNIKRDLSVDQTPIMINRENFDFSLYLYYDTIWNPQANQTENIQDQIDQYLNVKLFRTQIIIPSFSDVGNNGYQVKQDQLKLEKCGMNGLKKMKSQLSALMVDYYCPQDNYTIPLYGTYTSPSTSSMKVEITLCDQEYLDQLYPNKGLKCKSEAEILRVINYINFRFALATDYFDSKDYDNNPIKPTSRLMINNFSKNVTQQLNFKVGQNTVILKDTKLYSALEVQNLTYHEIKLDYSQMNERSGNKQVLMMMFSADENVQITERKAFTIMDALSNTGGMMGTIFAILQFLLHTFQKNIFISSIMKRLYYYQNSSDKKCKDVKQIKIQPKQDEPNLGKIENKMNGSHYEKECWDDQQLDLNSTGKNFIKKQNERIQQELLDYIKSLAKYRFCMTHFLKYKVKLTLRILCRCVRLNTTENLYSEGRNRIDKELDIIRVLRAVRKVELLESLLLTTSQQKLIPYLKQSVLKKQDEFDKQRKTMKTMNDQCLEQHIQSIFKDKTKQSSMFIKQLGIDIDDIKFGEKVYDDDNSECIDFEQKIKSKEKLDDDDISLQNVEQNVRL